MAGREVSRRMTLRQLEATAPERSGPATPIAPEPTAPSAARTAPPSAPVRREASDLRLRERQRLWLEARARFERAQDSENASSSAK